MECRFEKETVIPLSLCDDTGRLSVQGVFSVFMDLAAEHAELIELGADKLAEKGVFWLTVRTKIHITERPKMMAKVRGCTWPEAPGRVRCNRFYALCDDNVTYAEGVTEWALIDVNSGKLCKASDIYIPGTVFSQEKPDVAPFDKIPDSFDEAQKIDEYRIRSSDIDLGHHMNNSAYVRALLGAVSCKELGERNILGAEVVFKQPCYEGDVLSIYRRDTDSGFDMAMAAPDGRMAILARFAAK
ncbi:MAG: hypothetical protein IKT81_05890 [Clostridia bacterium]|nr:hypothetical protein [Clostridia bacterium]